MSIGTKRERVRFVRRVRTKRDDGGFDVVPATLAELWAEVKPADKPELESVQSGHLVSPTLYYIYVDAKAVSPTADDTLIWLTRGNLEMNVRNVRMSNVRIMDLQITAEVGVTISG